MSRLANETCYQAKGTAENSYVANLLEELRQAKETGNLSDSAVAAEETSIKWSAGALYGAGAETVRIYSAFRSSHLSSLFFAVGQLYEYVLLDDDFTPGHPVSSTGGG